MIKHYRSFVITTLTLRAYSFVIVALIFRQANIHFTLFLWIRHNPLHLFVYGDAAMKGALLKHVVCGMLELALTQAILATHSRCMMEWHLLLMVAIYV